MGSSASIKHLDQWLPRYSINYEFGKKSTTKKVNAISHQPLIESSQAGRRPLGFSRDLHCQIFLEYSLFYYMRKSHFLKTSVISRGNTTVWLTLAEPPHLARTAPRTTNV